MEKQITLSTHALRLSLFILSLCGAVYAPSQAEAQSDRVCKHAGKEIDFNDPDVKAFIEGEVTCIKDYGDGKLKERFKISKGLILEEELKTSSRHEIKRYRANGRNTAQHGEQIEYWPGTEQVKSKVTFDNGAKIGLEIDYYKNGKVSEKSFHAKQDSSDRNSISIATIAYNESGKLRHVRCSENKSQTIDPSICGFNGKSTVETYDSNGNLREKEEIVNGKTVTSESEAKAPSYWGSVLETGTLRDPKAAKRRKENQANGDVVITDLFTNGKPKRKMVVDSDGSLKGVDQEWFESGAAIRRTEFERAKVANSRTARVKQSECWWENGKTKLVVKPVGDQYAITSFWDNGKVSYQGTFYVSSEGRYWTADGVSELIQCEVPSYSLGKEGRHEQFDKDGQPIGYSTYKRDVFEGLQGTYERPNESAKSVLVSESTFIAGKVTKVRTFKDEKLVKTEEYFSDGSLKSSTDH